MTGALPRPAARLGSCRSQADWLHRFALRGVMDPRVKITESEDVGSPAEVGHRRDWAVAFAPSPVTLQLHVL